jgi:hypothetical protein
MPTLAVAINITLFVALLGLALLFWRVNQKLQVLMRSSERLPALSQTLTEALNKAQSALQGLNRTTAEQVPAISEKVRLANATINDLTYLLDRAEKVLAHLEAQNNRVPAQALYQQTSPLASRSENIVEMQTPRAVNQTPLNAQAYAQIDRYAKVRSQREDSIEAEKELRRALQEIL